MQIQSIGALSHRRFPTITECPRPGRCHTEGSQTWNIMFCGQRGCLNCSTEYSLRAMNNHIRFACRDIPTCLHATIYYLSFVYRYTWYFEVSGICKELCATIQGSAFGYMRSYTMDVLLHHITPRIRFDAVTRVPER